MLYQFASFSRDDSGADFSEKDKDGPTNYTYETVLLNSKCDISLYNRIYIIN